MAGGNSPQRRKAKREHERNQSFPSNSEVDEFPKGPEQKQITHEKEAKQNMAGWIKANILTTQFFSVLFAGVLCLFTYLLYKVSDATNDTARATQRASLNFSGLGAGVGLSDPANAQSRVGQEILINWSNSGNTPAKNAVARASYQEWPTDLPKEFEFNDIEPGGQVPIALGPHELSGIRIDLPITSLERQRDAKARLYFWGWVVYDDIFPGDPPHVSEFCTEMIQVAIQPGKVITDATSQIAWNNVRCPQHNCYDADCKDYKKRIEQARP